MARRVVRLGDLRKGRVFFHVGSEGRVERWQVTKNLGVAGVSCRQAGERVVEFEGRKFTARLGERTVVFTASAPVEVNAR
jgi:hypothetical protein